MAGTDDMTGGAQAAAPTARPAGGLWFVVHTYSGLEAKVKVSLDERRRQEIARQRSDLTALEAQATHTPREEGEMVDLRTAIEQLEGFYEVLVPAEKVVELVKGQRKTSMRKFLPGYVLIHVASLGDYLKAFIRSVPRVTGFVGGSDDPPAISEAEVHEITQQMEEGPAKPRVLFAIGDNIKVIDGPFQDFNGVVDDVKADKGKLRVLISIFGRATPVELEFVQVEKV